MRSLFITVKMMNREKRNSVIDIYKGIGITLMLMGHVGFGDISSHIAHAFHMPMFFFISGFLYNDKKENSIKGWICHKSKKLLYPYLIFGVMNYIVYALLRFLRGEVVSIYPMYHLLFVNTTGMASGSLWFLTALLVANILFYIVNSEIEKEWLKQLLIIIISFMGIFAAQYLPFRLPYAIDAGMVGCGLQYAGYLIHKKMTNRRVKRIFNLSIIEIIGAGAALSVLILLNGEINMRNGLYHNLLLFWLNAIAGSILVYNIAVHLSKWKSNKWFPIGKGIRIIEGMGMNSLIFVCTNDIIVAEMKNFLRLILVKESKIVTIIIHIATLIITIGVIDLIAHCLPVFTCPDRIKRISAVKGEK